MIKELLLKIIKGLYGVIIVVALWYLLSMLIGTNMVPSPKTTIYELIRLLQNDFIYHILYSMYRILGAILISLIIGIPVGIALGLSSSISTISYT